MVTATGKEKKGKEEVQEKDMGSLGNGKVVSELVTFIESAERMGNYPSSTAGGMKAALRLASSVLTEEEANSLDTLSGHIDQIFQRIFNKYKSKMNPSSIATYRQRLQSAVSDYEKHGQNPSAMASWKRKVRMVGSRRAQPGGQPTGRETLPVTDLSGPSMIRLELPVRPNAKAIVLIPADLNRAEADRIKKLIDASVVSE